MAITPILGTIMFLVMSAGIIPREAGLQAHWTTPAVIHGFMQGGIR